MIVIAPAGAGVREVLLIVFLTPVIGSGPAIAVAACSRAVNTISDLLVAGVGRRDPPSRAQRLSGDRRGKGQPPIATETVTPVASAPDVAS